MPIATDVPVAVTGLGCLCATGTGVPACLAGLFSAPREPAPPRRFATGHPRPPPVFELVDFGAPADGEDLLRTCRLAEVAAVEALAAAGLGPAELAQRRVGVCIGTTVGCSMDEEAFYREYRAGGDPDLAHITRFLDNNPATVLARRHRCTGPRLTVLNACSSGTDAIGLAAGWIRAGLCEVVIAGGAEELCRITYHGFAALMAASPDRCRPFDRRRAGLNLGEGAGILVLESAASRGGRPMVGTVLGYGTAGDAHHLTAPHPDGTGLRRALADALARSGLAPTDLAFVNVHGTGTPDNDRVESLVLADLLPGVILSATKGATGHTLGAAGAIEAVITLACLAAGRLPPSAGLLEPDPELPAHPVMTSTPITGRYALSQSLAFGGINSALVLGAPP
jgi:3-oxoacyl-[acyl-carrier-protein] synthase-1/3-oxoacyl-[acyl-carrier-protein] synthase II